MSYGMQAHFMGRSTELFAAGLLVEAGLFPSEPLMAVSKYDYVISTPAGQKRVQIKTAKAGKKFATAHLNRTGNSNGAFRESAIRQQPYKDNDWDILGIFLREPFKLYAVPVEFLDLSSGTVKVWFDRDEDSEKLFAEDFTLDKLKTVWYSDEMEIGGPDWLTESVKRLRPSTTVC